MMAIPDISVVMGVHNNVGTLPAALASIQSQEDVALEFIVIDDGSADGSAAILDEAAEKDPRLRVVHKKNEGLTRALIDGCALATAPWIARQDADDVSLPGRLKMQLARARQADRPELVACGSVWTCPEGERLFEARPPADAATAVRKIIACGETLCPHGAILMCADAYRAVGGYRAPFYVAQDLDLVVRLAERGRIAAVPDPLYSYRFSPGSITGRHRAAQQAYRHLALRCHAARAQGESEMPWLEQAAALAREMQAGNRLPRGDFEGLYFIASCLRKTNPRLARHYYAQALRMRPWSLAAFARWLAASSRKSAKGEAHARSPS